jgi:hypothetical protein
MCYLDGGEHLRMPLRRWIGRRGYTALFSLFRLQLVIYASSDFYSIKISVFKTMNKSPGHLHSCLRLKR